MGIGLHLVKVIMEAHRGVIEAGNYIDERLSDDFKDGAIIKIKFPKK